MNNKLVTSKDQPPEMVSLEENLLNDFPFEDGEFPGNLPDFPFGDGEFPGNIPDDFGFLSASTTTVNETDNNTVTFTLETADTEEGEIINAGDTLEVDVEGNISDEDVEGELPSTVTVGEDSNTTLLDLTFSADETTEGKENFFVEGTIEGEEPDSTITLFSQEITVEDSSQDASEDNSNEDDGNGDDSNGDQEESDNGGEPVNENDDGPLQTNILILDGSNQTLPIAFDVNIRGTSGEETVLVQDSVSVNFNPQSGDRVDVSQDLADYTIERTGLTELTLTENNSEDTISLTVNQGEEFELRFADGNTTVNLTQEGVIIGNEVLGDGDQADSGNITLGDKLSQVSDSDDNNDSEVNDELAPLPNQGGPDEVTNGTANSDNIDGDKDNQTLSGDAGIDRFIFNNLVNDQGNPVDQEVTINDFTEGEQLFFEGGFSQEDVTINNSDTDGEVTLQISNTDITITGLSDQDDNQVLNSSEFEEVFGDQALEFA